MKPDEILRDHLCKCRLCRETFQMCPPGRQFLKDAASAIRQERKKAYA